MKSIFNIFFLVCFMLSKNSFLFRVYCIIISKCRLGCFVFLRLYWVFIKSVFVVGSEAVAVCDILIFKNITFCRNYLSCLFVIFCFGRVFDWEILDCFLDCSFWLFDLIDCSDWLFFIERLCFLRKKKNYGRTVHCKFPLLNPMSKWVRSDSRFKRLIFWFGRVLFVVKTLLCSERRFANDEKVKSFAK